MSDKELFERHFLERFIKVYTDLPIATIVKSESPDFLIKGENETVGIEISKIVNEKSLGERYSPSERNACEQKIVRQALQFFLEKHNIPLRVNFAFHDSIDVGGGQAKVLAHQLARLVAEHAMTQSLTENFYLRIDSRLPRELIYCGIAYYPGISDSIWYSGKGQFIPNLTKQCLLRVIQKKEVKVNEYKRKADRLILLLVEGIIPESWFDKIELVEMNELNSNFDKILIFRNLSEEIVVIK